MPYNDPHHVVKTSAQWDERAIEFWVVPRGCLCVELTPEGKTKIKIGEGNKFYSQLPYVNDMSDLENYYTKEEVDNIVTNINLMAIRSTDEYDTKNDLPTGGNKLGDVRFVKSPSPSIKTDPDIYLWNGSRWIYVGYELQDIDLSQYLKKDEFHELFDPVREKVEEMYPKMHTHENKNILDRIEEPYSTAEKEKLAGLENYDDTEIRELIAETGHTHPNKPVLDTITDDSLWSESDRTKFESLHNYDDTGVRNRLTDLESAAHTHSNKNILDQVTAAFTVEDKTKLDSLHNNEVFIGTDGMYGGREGLVPAPTIIDAGKFLCADGTWKAAGEIVYDFRGATASEDGTNGLVPAPMAGEQSYYLRGDGTWAKVKQGGDKYKAGDGIFILSGEVISDTFPFEAYSKSGHLSQYIIYGNTGGVGESMGSGTYGVNISVTDEHGNTSNTSIILPEKISFGDYIDYERQVFVHMRTNVSSLVNTVDPNYRYRWAIRSNGDISPTDVGAYGSSPQVTTLAELEPGTTYELYHACPYPAFSNYMNLNVYDVDQNRTRTMNFYDSTGKVPTIIALASNEKYIRLTWEHADWYPNTLIKVKAVETPITLPQIPLFPNSINTINVTNTIKPAEIYVEVAEPSEDDPDDPMSDFTGIIYNEGVLDITQEDPNALNELTVHFRESDKVITVPAGHTYTAGDGIDIDANDEISVKLGSGLQFDANGAIESTGEIINYIAGDGIDISRETIDPDYYFESQVTCSLTGSFSRSFTKTTSEPAFGALITGTAEGQSDHWTGPLFVGKTSTSVGRSYMETSYSMEYLGETWYYGDFNYFVDGDLTDLNNNLVNLSGVYENTAIGRENAAKALIDAALAGGQDKVVSVVPATTQTLGGIIVGENLTIDENGVLSSTGGGGVLYDAGDGIEFTYNHMIDMLFDRTAFLDSVTSVQRGTISKDTITGAFTLTATGNDAYTLPDRSSLGTVYSIQADPNTTYKLTWTSDDPTVHGNVFVFENGDIITMYLVDQATLNELTFITSRTCQTLNFRFGVQNSGDSLTYSDIALYKIIGDATINAKLGNGLSFDQNDAIQVNQMTGADGTNAGAAGIVPAPTATDNTKFLRGDGSWAEIETPARYVEGDAIEFGHPGMTDLGFDFDTFVSKFTQPNNGTVSVDSANKAFTLAATGSDCYTNPWVSGSLYTIPVIGGRKYRLTWNSNASNVDGTIYAFENANTSHMHGVNQAEQNYLEFTADTSSNVNFRFGVTNSGNSITYSNIKFYEVDNADPDTNIINVKYGNGLSLDNNNALQVDGMVGATSQANGESGTVPQPLIADKDKFLKGDGTWDSPPSYTLPAATDQSLGGVKVGDGLEIDEEGVLSASGGNDYTAGEGIDINRTTRPIDINYIRLDINNSRDNGSGHIIQFRNIRVLDSNGNSLQFSHASSIYGDGSAVEYGQNTRDESPQAMIEGRNKTCCTNFSLTKAPLKITFTLTSEISIANITSFSILTGADHTERDPVSWDIYASNDGMTWYKIQEAHSPDVTTARSTWITDIPFVIPPDAVEILPGVKTITAKLGTGLQFDANGAIEVQPATTTTLGGVKVGAGLSMNANDELGVASPYVTSVANQGSVPGVITVAKSDGTSSDVDILGNIRLILNCNFDSSVTRNVLGEPVNAPVAANKTLSSIMENDLTILEV